MHPPGPVPARSKCVIVNTSIFFKVSAHHSWELLAPLRTRQHPAVPDPTRSQRVIVNNSRFSRGFVFVHHSCEPLGQAWVQRGRLQQGASVSLSIILGFLEGLCLCIILVNPEDKPGQPSLSLTPAPVQHSAVCPTCRKPTLIW